MGQWLWTCRAGYEPELIEELTSHNAALQPIVVGPALVATRSVPGVDETMLQPAFARQSMPVQHLLEARTSAALEAPTTTALRAIAPEGPWALHVWVADSDATNPLARTADLLQRSIELRAAAVDLRWGDRRVPSGRHAANANGLLAQVCVVSPGRVAVGAGPAARALSVHPGGRARMRVDDRAPSRAARKLAEALEQLGHGPSAGERCVDLGAAPGGWSFVLLERGARVVAVDPGEMHSSLVRRSGLVHIRGSAFDYEPREPVDWLFCDMVWRPLEVVALLGRWARKRWTRLVVANVKLPMRGKIEFLARIRITLHEAGWRDVRMRQLYHDREEITLTAHVDR